MTDYENRIADCRRLREEVDRFRPLDAHTLEQLRRYYRVGFTYTSNAIEGNTLSESETKVILEDGITIGGKPIREHLEAIGHAKAFDALENLVRQPQVAESDILALHRLTVGGIDEAEPGAYRNKPVIITGTEFIPPPPDALPPLMYALFMEKLPLWERTKDPVELAALAHLELVTIHPFADGNGRTARLLMNLLLLRHGHGVTLIPPVLRSDYMALLRLAQVERNVQPFLNFISDRVYESMKDLLRLLRALRT